MIAPPDNTLSRWAWDYVTSTDLAHKLAPPPTPRAFEDDAPVRRIERPGRPAELVANDRRFKTPRPGALKVPERRAELLHTFLHHELQAAELMCWAILAFPDTPRAFKVGLAAIARDEVRHMALYREAIESYGQRVGGFPVNDWFWERVPRATSAASFVATLGIGFEGANLDHALRFAEHFRNVGDERGAAIQEQVHFGAARGSPEPGRGRRTGEARRSYMACKLDLRHLICNANQRRSGFRPSGRSMRLRFRRLQRHATVP